MGFVSSLQSSIDKFLLNFKPTYKVSAVTYFFLPGIPVNKNISEHEFGKGEYIEAKEFYHKVIRKTESIGISPAEILLIKGKKKVLEKKVIGPLAQLKNLPMTINAIV
jgi:hypothetical protein